MTDRPAYASVLYLQLIQARDAVAGSFRGQGTPDQLASVARLEARIADLEGDSPGSAWTPVDGAWWASAKKGTRVALLPGHRAWLALVSEADGTPLPRGLS